MECSNSRDIVATPGLSDRSGWPTFLIRICNERFSIRHLETHLCISRGRQGERCINRRRSLRRSHVTRSRE